jgi:hypothetical protein
MMEILPLPHKAWVFNLLKNHFESFILKELLVEADFGLRNLISSWPWR